MKTISLQEHLRLKAHAERRLVGSDGSLLLPEGVKTNSKWPMCATCLREVDRVELENINNTSCEIRAWHHGAEDTIRVTWPNLKVHTTGVDILEDLNVGWAIKRAMHDSLFFRPEHMER